MSVFAYTGAIYLKMLGETFLRVALVQSEALSSTGDRSSIVLAGC